MVAPGSGGIRAASARRSRRSPDISCQRPAWQCGQRPISMAATRRMNSRPAPAQRALGWGMRQQARAAPAAALGRRREQPIVANALEAQGQHVMQQTRDELLPSTAMLRLPWAGRSVLGAHPQAHLRRLRWPAAARCRWPCDGCSATDSPARPPACQRRLGVHHPVVLAQRGRARAAALGGCRIAWQRRAGASSRAARNLPRNTRDSACTGNRKSARARGAAQQRSAILAAAQRAASHQRMHMQWRLKSCVQVCSTRVKRQRRRASARLRQTRVRWPPCAA